MSRDRRIVINMILSLLIKGFGLIISLFLMPAYMNYFSNQQVLGLWFTILSLLNWVLTFDFGVGNGLRNNLVRALTNNNIDEEKTLISTTYWMSFKIAAVLFVGCSILISTVNWNTFFNISSDTINVYYLRKALFIVLVGIIIQFILKVITSILLSMQMPSISNSVGLVSNMVLLIAVLSLKNLDDTANLINLSYIYLLASDLPLIILTFAIFSTFMYKSRPSLKSIDSKVEKSIIKLGGGFFVLQLLSLALFSMNDILITRLSGPSFVIEFQIYNRIFGLVSSFAWIGLIPIWSAVTEACEKGEYLWVLNAYKRLKYSMIIVISGLLVLILTMQYIVNLWLGTHTISINTFYSIAFAISCSLNIWWGILASFSNGTGKIRIQIVLSVVGIVLYLSLSTIFVMLLKSWIGVILANILSMIPYCIIEPRYINKLLEVGNHGQK